MGTKTEISESEILAAAYARCACTALFCPKPDFTDSNVDSSSGFSAALTDKQERWVGWGGGEGVGERRTVSGTCKSLKPKTLSSSNQEALSHAINRTYHRLNTRSLTPTSLSHQQLPDTTSSQSASLLCASLNTDRFRSVVFV